MRKKLFIFFIFALILGSFNFANAQEGLEIYFFYGKTCPHCAEEKAFLEGLEEKYEGLRVKEFAVSENFKLLEDYYRNYQVPERVHGWVPVTFIEEKCFLGFSEEIGKEMEEYIKNKVEREGGEPCSCPNDSAGSLEEVSTPFEIEEEIRLPFLGKIKLGDYSLPALAVVLGFFDGFNVCSLGALVLILSLVLALRERKRIFTFGGIFILTTAIIYGLLIVLWYRVFSLFANYLRAMEIVIGLLGVGGGIYFLRQFIRYKKYGPACESDAKKGVIARLSSKIRNLLEGRRNIVLTAFGVLLFAAVVTVVEFPCSAAIPVLFAGILAKAQLSSFSYLLYIGIFVFFYMLDEFVIFLAAALTMSIKLISPKVLIYITLLASLVLFFLGFYYLFGFL